MISSTHAWIFDLLGWTWVRVKPMFKRTKQLFHIARIINISELQFPLMLLYFFNMVVAKSNFLGRVCSIGFVLDLKSINDAIEIVMNIENFSIEVLEFLVGFHSLIHFFQIDGITIGSLDDVPTGAVRSFFSSIRNTLDFDFEDEDEGWFYKCWVKRGSITLRVMVPGVMFATTL